MAPVKTKRSAEDAMKTPTNVKQWEDIRKQEGSMKYPDFEEIKTRSGHCIIYDDSKDNESIIIQHRGGSKMIFMPDGAVQIVAHNGQQTVTYGENEVIITGRHDITVKGDASLRVEQDMNMTVQGDMKTTVSGNYELAAKNINQLAAEQFAVKAQGVNVTATKNVKVTAEQGSATLSAQGNAMIKSLTDTVTMSGVAGVGMRTEGGWAAIQGATCSIRASGIVGIDGSQTLMQQNASLPEMKNVIIKIPNSPVGLSPESPS